MPKTRIPSPARSQGGPTTPRRNPRAPRSVGSPARSTTSCKLTTVIQNSKETNHSFVLSPLPTRRSLLTDTTDVGEPRRKSWWKKLGENSRDVMEVLEDNEAVVNNVVEELDVEVLSQEQKSYTLDLPDSSDSESISSIVIPQRKLFTQTQNQPQNKYGQLIGRRESMAKLQKTNIENEKTINPGKKTLFGHSNKLRSKPIFPAELLKISPNKTANKTKEIVATEVQGPPRSLFGNRPAMKRKNMFTDFIVSESEDEISEIQPRVFGFQKKAKQDEGKMPLAYVSSASHGPREPSPTNSMTKLLDISGYWKLLPSSTMVQEMEEDDDSEDNLGNLAYSDDEPNDNTIEENVNIQNSKNMSQAYSDNDTSKKRELEENQLHNSNKLEQQNKTREEGQDKEGNDQEATEKENDNQKITNECDEILLETRDDGKAEEKQTKVDNKETPKLEVVKETIYENVDIQTKSGKILTKNPANENQVENELNYETAPVLTSEIEEHVSQDIQHNIKQKHNLSQKSNKDHIKSYHKDGPELDENIQNKNQDIRNINEEPIEDEHMVNDEMDQEPASGIEEQDNEMQEIQHKSKQVHNVSQLSNKELKEDDQNRSEKFLDVSHRTGIEEQHEDDRILNDEIENQEGESKNMDNKIHKDLKVSQRREIKEQDKILAYVDQVMDGLDENMQELENIKKKIEIHLSKNQQLENVEQNKDPALDENMEEVDKSQDIQNKNETSLRTSRKTENVAQNKKDHEKASDLTDEIEEQVNQEFHHQSKQVHNFSQNIHEPDKKSPKLAGNVIRPENKSKEMLDETHRTENEEQCEENHVLDNEIEDQEDEDQEDQDKSEKDLKVSEESEVQEEDDADMEELEDENQNTLNKSEEDLDKSQESEDEVQSEADHEEGSKIDNEMEEQEDDNQETGQTDEEINVSQESENEEEMEEQEDDNQETGQTDEEINVSQESENEEEMEEQEDDNQETEQTVAEINVSQKSQNEELDKSQETENVDQSDAENEHQNEAENEDQSDADHEEDPGQNMEDSENETDEDDEVDEQEISQEIENESQENLSEGEEVQIESDDDEKVYDNETDDVRNTEHKSRNHSQDTKNDKSRVKSPEAILHDVSNQMDSFTVRGRNTSIGKTKSMIKDLNIRPSLAPPRESTGFSDGTKNSSAEGSGWDSHRITKKTLRQTFGKDFTPRKSLRTLVMEKSAKRHTAFNNDNDTIDVPRANSTEYPDATNRYDDIENNAHEISKRARQTTLDMYLQKIKKDNMEKRKKMEEAISNSLRAPTSDTLNLFKMPARPNFVKRSNNKTAQNKPKTKETKSLIPLDLPEELLEDMKYRPPKRFKPSNAGWVTKRLYKYLETKLEPKYDYKARIRAEKLVETIYNFTKDIRRHHVAPTSAVDVLKHEMARLGIVTTHHEFYGFIHEFMPREVRVKVVPDIVNKIPLPRLGPFSNILRDVQG